MSLYFQLSENSVFFFNFTEKVREKIFHKENGRNFFGFGKIDFSQFRKKSVFHDA